MRAIITYHSIDDSGSPVSLDPKRFAAHVDAWARMREAIVPLDAVRGAADGSVAFTFDDAFASFKSAWPRMRDQGLPVTLFVVTGHVGKTNLWGGKKHPSVPEMPLMDWDAIARVAEEGVQLGAHSRTHPHLTGLSDAAIEDELSGSREEIRQRTGKDVSAFAYPYGDHDARTVRLAAAHYELALTTEMRALRAGDDPHRLPRFDAHYLSGPADPAKFGGPGFRAWLGARALMRSVRERFARW